MASRIDDFKALFEPVIEAMGYRLWGIEYIGQGRHSLLRVFIDKDGGIDVEDCALVSHQVSGILDVEDPISGEYTLEVSSPGLDRPLFTLEQFAAYVGEDVKVRLRQGLDNRRNFQGRLQAIGDGTVSVLIDAQEFVLPFDLIEKASLVAKL